MCLDDRKLNVSIKKYQYPLPFTDQILERVDGHEFYYFFYGSSSYHQFEVDLEDQDKNLILNWEKCPFMVSFGIFLGHVVFFNYIILFYFLAFAKLTCLQEIDFGSSFEKFEVLSKALFRMPFCFSSRH